MIGALLRFSGSTSTRESSWRHRRAGDRPTSPRAPDDRRVLLSRSPVIFVAGRFGVLQVGSFKSAANYLPHGRRYTTSSSGRGESDNRFWLIARPPGSSGDPGVRDSDAMSVITSTWVERDRLLWSPS